MAQNRAEIVIGAKDEATNVIRKVANDAFGFLLSPVGLATSAMAGFVLAVKNAISESSKMEQATANFTTLTGSVENARNLVQDLYDLGSKTPLQFSDLEGPTTKLLAFGAATKDTVIPTLQMLGDTALGNGEKLDRISLAFGQIHAAGKASMQDVNQLIDAGVPLLTELSNATGLSVGELRKMVEQGKITSDVVTQSFRRMTSEGGMFYKGMENQSKTLAGQWSTMKDNISMAFSAMGDIIAPALKAVIGYLSPIPEKIKEAFKSDAAIEFGYGVREVMLNVEYWVKRSMIEIKAIFDKGFDKKTLGMTAMATIEELLNSTAKLGTSGLSAVSAFAEKALSNTKKTQSELYKESNDYLINILGLSKNNSAELLSYHLQTTTDMAYKMYNLEKETAAKRNQIKKEEQEKLEANNKKGVDNHAASEQKKTTATVTETEKQKNARKKALEDHLKEQQQTDAQIVSATIANQEAIRESLELELKSEEWLREQAADEEKKRLDGLEDYSKSSLERQTWQEKITQDYINRIKKEGKDSQLAAGQKFALEWGKVIDAGVTQEKNAGRAVTEAIKNELKSRIAAFVVEKIAEVWAWGWANSVMTFGGSLIAAGVASAGLVSATQGVYTEIDRLANQVSPPESDEQRMRRELMEEKEQKTYNEKKELMRQQMGLSEKTAAATPTTQATFTTSSISTSTSTGPTNAGGVIQVNVVLDKQTLGTAIVDLTRQKQLGVI